MEYMLTFRYTSVKYASGIFCVEYNYRSKRGVPEKSEELGVEFLLNECVEVYVVAAVLIAVLQDGASLVGDLVKARLFVWSDFPDETFVFEFPEFAVDVSPAFADSQVDVRSDVSAVVIKILQNIEIAGSTQSHCFGSQR